MTKKIKITDYKTKRINSYTGGLIGTYQIPDYEVTEHSDGILHDSFLTQDGTYLGSYEIGWMYVRYNMLICFEHPHGVAIKLKRPAKNYEYLADYMTDGRVGGDDIDGYYGYSHRGGATFKIGDRLFDSDYTPLREDYPAKEWAEYIKQHDEYVAREIKEGFYKTEEEARKSLPISDVIPFLKRGSVIIRTWDEAMQAANNICKDLS